MTKAAKNPQSAIDFQASLLQCTGSQAGPSNSFGEVARAALTSLAGNTEIVFSCRVALVGRLTKPSCGLHIVLRHPSTVVIHASEMCFASCLSVGRGFPVPGERLILIPSKPDAVGI